MVASLAVADLFVACLVMPLGAVYEISRGWILGPELCDIWTSCDVLCCTASILHLVAIATDRYWAVTNIDYIHSRTSRRVFTMIFLVWFASVIVSLAPQFGWKDPEYLQRIEQQKCMVSQNIAYQEETPKPKSKIRFHLKKKFTNPTKSAVSSLGLVEGNSTNTVNTVEDTEDSTNAADRKGLETTFSGDEGNNTPVGNNQIPTVSYEVTHQQLAQAATGSESNNNNPRTNDLPASKTPSPSGNGGTLPPVSACPVQPNQLATSPLLPPHHHQPQSPRAAQDPAHHHQLHHHHQHNQQSAAKQPPTVGGHLLATPVGGGGGSTLNISSTPNPHAQVSKRKETLEAKRERKAAKTLAIITGAFVVCWLPFFLTALLLPLCESCSINDTVASLFLWLGYFNSTLNPVIYTIFSPEFRQAFKRILFGSHRSTNYRRGKL
uniref:G-protein coupled receptors family 1 profile domain-containing protein n=1 Tax=Anopheles maculatus TaxID=74869 RepID=A0A182SI43_9DIPT